MLILALLRDRLQLHAARSLFDVASLRARGLKRGTYGEDFRCAKPCRESISSSSPTIFTPPAFKKVEYFTPHLVPRERHLHVPGRPICYGEPKEAYLRSEEPRVALV